MATTRSSIAKPPPVSPAKSAAEGIYFRNLTAANPTTPSIFRIPRGGGAPVALSYGIPGLSDYEVAADAIYYVSMRSGLVDQGEPGVVGRVSKEGGEPERLFERQDESAQAIEIGELQLYFSMGFRSRATTKIYALDLGGGEPRELGPGCPNLLLVGDCLVFEEVEGIGMMSVDGRNRRRVTELTADSSVSNLFVEMVWCIGYSIPEVWGARRLRWFDSPRRKGGVPVADRPCSNTSLCPPWRVSMVWM
jgi:hypothetical protein